ncbi:MAG TPA: indolepyruvate oxidoreductase subunit beta family protein [Burkholderiales bacterium]
MNPAAQRPLGLLICALGGEGGGVLAEWLVETATRCGYSAQSTSIPGVAQRTGSTTYYFEVFPVPLSGLAGRRPVFSLYPVPGTLDVLVSSELLETARHIGHGMASADRTLVVTSSARTLTTAEKMQLADGRASSAELLKTVADNSRAARIFDMAEVARETGTVLSAVLFGAIAGSGVLPFPREAFEETIRKSGKGVEANLRGFASAHAIVSQGLAQPSPDMQPASVTPELPAGIAGEFPAATHAMLAAGFARMLEYQDGDYAKVYVQRLRRILDAERAADPAGRGEFSTTSETARYLALWMAFDDIVRVADLKCRASRFARVRREVKANEEELVRVYDHFKPGVPEFAALLPERAAGLLLRWDARRRKAGKDPFALPLKIGTHTIFGFLALRVLGSLRGLRRRGSRFAREQAMIGRWLAAVEQGTRADWRLGQEIALCGRLIKGYGTTNERGKDNLLHVLDHLAVAGGFATPLARIEAIRAARVAALADDAGKALDQALVKHGAAPRPVRGQPIRWVKKQRSTVT